MFTLRDSMESAILDYPEQSMKLFYQSEPHAVRRMMGFYPSMKNEIR
jgi:hypothetical protein